MSLHPSIIVRHVAKATASADHHPLPLFKPTPMEMFLHVEPSPKHNPRWKWFWTGVAFATGLACLVAAAAIRLS